VAHRMLLRRVYLGKCLVHAVGDEDGIVAEAMIAARRESEMAMHLAFEYFGCARWHRHTQSADKFCAAGHQPLVPQLVMNAVHGDAEILGWSGPTRRINPRRAIQRL